MRFWHSSAIVPLLVEERRTAAMVELYDTDEAVVVWTFTDLELRSALARAERDGRVAPAESRLAIDELERHWPTWSIIVSLEAVKARAQRVIRLHTLKAADSLQLAAALVASEDRPTSATFITLDTRLAEAARREGFRVLPQ